jgi:hypothetical protein
MNVYVVLFVEAYSRCCLVVCNNGKYLYGPGKGSGRLSNMLTHVLTRYPDPCSTLKCVCVYIYGVTIHHLDLTVLQTDRANQWSRVHPCGARLARLGPTWLSCVRPTGQAMSHPDRVVHPQPSCAPAPRACTHVSHFREWPTESREWLSNFTKWLSTVAKWLIGSWEWLTKS